MARWHGAYPTPPRLQKPQLQLGTVNRAEYVAFQKELDDRSYHGPEFLSTLSSTNTTWIPDLWTERNGAFRYSADPNDNFFHIKSGLTAERVRALLDGEASGPAGVNVSGELTERFGAGGIAEAFLDWTFFATYVHNFEPFTTEGKATTTSM